MTELMALLGKSLARCRHGAAILAMAALAACGGGGDPPSLSVGANAVQTASVQTASVQALAVSGSVAASDPTVVGLTKLSETRVGRTVFDYVFRITVRNGNVAQTGLAAQLTGSGPGTSVIDGNVLVGNLAPGASATPSDTITLRQDRNSAFQPGLLVWQFSAAGPTPASIALDVAQRVIGAGNPLALLPTVLDTNGQTMNPPPAINYALLPPGAGTAGSVPTVTNGLVNSGADTRGSFSVRATVAGTNLSATANFTVLQNNSQSANAGLHATLSAAQAALARQLRLAAAAQQRGDSVALAAAMAAIQAAAGTVDPDRLVASTAYEPDTGFFPTTATLSANGISPVAGDAGFGAASAQLRAKLAQITQLLNQPTGNDANDGALLGQYRNDLAAIAATLASPAAQPSLFGVVEQADAVSDMLAKDMPLLLKAMAGRTALTTNNLNPARTPDKLAAAATPSGQVTPNFLLGSLLGALGPIGELINSIYGDYLNQIENAAILLGVKGLLDAELAQTVRLEGLLSGASQSIFAYNYADSFIYLSGTTVSAMQGADVYLIGNGAVNALGGAGAALSKLPKNPRKIKELYDYFKGVKDAIDSVQQAYALAHQQPSAVFADSFDNGGCLFAISDSCIELYYPTGFRNVAGGGVVAFTVLMLVRTSGPRPQYGSALFNFAPNT